jgi:hypothetical protein
MKRIMKTVRVFFLVFCSGLLVSTFAVAREKGNIYSQEEEKSKKFKHKKDLADKNEKMPVFNLKTIQPEPPQEFGETLSGIKLEPLDGASDKVSGVELKSPEDPLGTLSGIKLKSLGDSSGKISGVELKKPDDASGTLTGVELKKLEDSNPFDFDFHP